MQSVKIEITNGQRIVRIINNAIADWNMNTTTALTTFDACVAYRARMERSE